MGDGRATGPPDTGGPSSFFMSCWRVKMLLLIKGIHDVFGSWGGEFGKGRKEKFVK